MYSTCLFCNKQLGSNESLETFPVGKRLAFDAAKGRLWVVCPHCERWNLSPLDERWEAIEQAEKLYSDTRRRISTDNIGLAKMRDGTTLVRIGEPLRPEFAAWRYGDQFGRRRRKQILMVTGGFAALGALVIAPAVAGVGVGGFGWMIARAGRRIVRGSPEAVVATIKGEYGETMRVRRRHLAETMIEPGSSSPLSVHLRFAGGSKRIEGAEAMRVASIIVPAANRFGGSKEKVAQAVSSIEQSGGAEGYLGRIANVAAVTSRVNLPASRGWRGGGGGSFLGLTWGGVQIGRRGRWSSRDAYSTGLFGINAVDRLALEMALHEEGERAALEGELGLLEDAWRDAEEIAAIADNLLVPDNVAREVERLHKSE